MNLLETIKVSKGKFENIEYHQDRINRSISDVYHSVPSLHLNELKIPDINDLFTYKCRIIYNTLILHIEYTPYIRKSIKTFNLVIADELQYPYKYENREEINRIKNQYPDTDEVIFVQNGLVTDSSFSNLALYDGKAWFTPATPLLSGTKRAQLLKKGILRIKHISPEEIHSFKKISFINAMNDLDDIVITL